MQAANKKKAVSKEELTEMTKEFDQLLHIPPMKLDYAKLRTTLEELEEKGAPKYLLTKGIQRLEYAERVQTKARVKILSARLEDLILPPRSP